MTEKTRLEQAVENLTDTEKAAMLTALEDPSKFGVTRVRTGGFYRKISNQKFACPLTLMYLQLGWLPPSALNGFAEFDDRLNDIFQTHPESGDIWMEFYRALDISALPGVLGEETTLNRLIEYLQPKV
jgi:hypothetical protein